MSERIEDFPMWKVGGSFATAAIVAWIFGIAGLALVLALIGAGFMLSAVVARRRKARAADSRLDTASRR